MDSRISNFSQQAFIQQTVLQNQMRFLDVNNGTLRFSLNLEKGLDIYQLWYKGTNISFLSKNGAVRENAPFASCFEGGMLYTCGLDSIGVREGYPLHGSYHSHTPTLTQCLCDESGITVGGYITDSALFGKQLIMHRTVHTEIGSDEIVLKDVLENRGTKDTEYCLLYHVNLGYPFLDEGVVIESDTATITPRMPGYTYPISERNLFSAPVDNEDERCYFIENRTPIVTATNKKLNMRFTLQYSADTLPKFVQWNSNASHDYALGLEPATSFLDGGFEYKTIRPNEKINFEIRIKLGSADNK